MTCFNHDMFYFCRQCKEEPSESASFMYNTKLNSKSPISLQYKHHVMYCEHYSCAWTYHIMVYNINTMCCIVYVTVAPGHVT